MSLRDKLSVVGSALSGIAFPITLSMKEERKEGLKRADLKEGLDYPSSDDMLGYKVLDTMTYIVYAASAAVMIGNRLDPGYYSPGSREAYMAIAAGLASARAYLSANARISLDSMKRSSKNTSNNL